EAGRTPGGVSIMLVGDGRFAGSRLPEFSFFRESGGDLCARVSRTEAAHHNAGIPRGIPALWCAASVRETRAHRSPPDSRKKENSGRRDPANRPSPTSIMETPPGVLPAS